MLYKFSCDLLPDKLSVMPYGKLLSEFKKGEIIVLNKESLSHWETASWLKHLKTAVNNILANTDYCGMRRNPQERRN